MKGSKIDFTERRLVSTGLNGLVIEWDLLSLLPKTKHNCNCAIWDSKIIGKYMALACHNGTIKIIKVKKSKIELVLMMANAGQTCLSVELVPSEVKQKKPKEIVNSDEESENEEEFELPFCHLFAGYKDGSIKLWNVKSNNCEQHFV